MTHRPPHPVDCEPLVIEVDLNAMALRYCLLSAHYRQPVEASPAAVKSSKKAIRRLLMAAEPCLDGPPLEIIETLSDDLNTPKALALCHGYRKSGDGKKLFAALRFLGFLAQAPLGSGEPKTIPDDHLPPHEVFGGMETSRIAQ